MSVYHILLRRGPKAELPAEGELGEPFLTTDTNQLFFGQGPGLPLAPLSIDDGEF
jgi:hypothetical protein